MYRHSMCLMVLRLKVFFLRKNLFTRSCCKILPIEPVAAEFRRTFRSSSRILLAFDPHGERSNQWRTRSIQQNASTERDDDAGWVSKRLRLAIASNLSVRLSFGCKHSLSSMKQVSSGNLREIYVRLNDVDFVGLAEGQCD
jgi:hypothetical protein